MNFKCVICGETISDKSELSKVKHGKNGVIKAWCTSCIEKHYQKSSKYHKSRKMKGYKKV